jgi:hypothetical protein
MFQDRTVRDLGVLTVVKLAVIALIYAACFARYDKPATDTAAHLLGPAGHAAAVPAPQPQPQGF